MIYKYCVVEDNPMAFKSLSIILEQYPQYHFKGHAIDVTQAMTMINAKQPELIFLDVELVGSNGMDVLKQINAMPDYKPSIIMTTSHEKYAVEAVNEDVLYFLTKPFDPEDLDKALIKFQNIYHQKHPNLNLKTADKYITIPFESITVIMGERNYVNIFQCNGTKVMISKNLKNISRMLPDFFIRIHKSYMVNQSLVKYYSFSNRLVRLSGNCDFSSLKLMIEERESQKKPDYKNRRINLKHQPTESNQLELPLGSFYFDTIKSHLS